MPQLISSPSRIPVPGGKVIEEYVGRVTTGSTGASVAHMTAPRGWEEPAQTPEFDEVTLVLRGTVRVEHDAGTLEIRAGQAVLARAGERVRYTTPEEAEYVAICLPAFAPELAHREGVTPIPTRRCRAVPRAARRVPGRAGPSATRRSRTAARTP